MMADADVWGRIRELERRLAAVEAKLGVAGAPEFQPDEGGVTPEIRRLAAEGKLIQAINLYRDTTGADLRTAKEAVEGLRP
jgi:large subunit ribosomal protein L7/L12